MAGDSLIAVGLSHRTAPVEVRERMAFSPDEVRRRLAELRHEHICDEAILLSTCNRVELYAVPSGGDITRVAAYLEAFPTCTGIAAEAPWSTCFGWPPHSTRSWSASHRSWVRCATP